ncbi:GMC oxidoreductase [Parapedomonas caeni]
MSPPSAAPTDTVDVLIVGAGAAGSLLAARLAQAGKSVLVLEAGPPWNGGDLVSSHIWSRRLRWGGPGVATTGAQPIGFGYNAGWGVGGAALHHYGTWPRLKPADFTMHSRYGRGLDWPIGYDDLRPYYDTIQEEVGVSGDAEAEVWRPAGAPYPMPPLQSFKQSAVLARGFKAMGKRVAPAPMAITSTEYKGRPACMYDGWCDAGCPIMALANPQVLYLPQAEEAGARIVANAAVTRLLASRKDRVDGVEYRLADGTLVRQSARLVILAASVVGNPALLLNSASDLHPRGIGNATGLVGRYVMTHALVQIAGLFTEETEPHLGVIGAHQICHDDYDKQATPGAFGSRQWLIAPAIKPNDLAGLANVRADLVGPALDAFMRRAVRHAANMIGMNEEEPHRDNRVELTTDTNAWGVKGARLVHGFSEDARKLWQAMADEGMAIFKAAGATDAWHSPMNSAHLMGGTVMGTARDNSVTDSHGRVHDLQNLFIAGAGLFPTSGAANPTFTLHALAARSAERIIAHWGQYAV